MSDAAINSGSWGNIAALTTLKQKSEYYDWNVTTDQEKGMTFLQRISKHNGRAGIEVINH